MRASRFSEAQIIGILREHGADAKTPELCRQYGISDAIFYKWKAKYGGLEVLEARRLEEVLEDENRRLKKLLAEAMLDNAALKDILGKTADACGAALNGWPADGRPQTEPTTRLPASAIRRCTISGAGPTMKRCASGCRSWRRNAGASAIGGWAGCWRARAKS